MIAKRISLCGEVVSALQHFARFESYPAVWNYLTKPARMSTHRTRVNSIHSIAIAALIFAATFFSAAVRAQSQPPPPPPPPATSGESSSKNPPDNSGTATPPPKTDAEKDLAALPAMDRLAAMQDIEVGTYYMNRGNLDAALDRFHDAATSYPTYAEPWRLMGIAYEKKGLLGDAIKSDQQYLKLYPHAQIRKKLEAHIEELQKKQQHEAQKNSGK
jgi:tetratricopeptide (TPR) repeat protein